MFESFATVTPQGRAIADLFLVALVISALILLLVYGVLAYTLARFRGRPGDPEPRQAAGNGRLETIWTATPAVILLVMFVLSVRTARVVYPDTPVAAPGGAGTPVRVQVIGHQWWWELRYPDQGFVTANELHVPVGVPVTLEITGADVVHSFWVPALGWKRDAVPGKTNTIDVRVDRAGTYDGACTEFCGLQHAWMRVRFVAETGADFQAWAAQQAQVQPGPPAGLPTPGATPAAGVTPSPAAAESLVTRGQRVFLTSTCINCHRIAGTPANGTAGPDLTHVGSRATIGAGVAENTPANMAVWVHDARAVKPGVLMPPFALSADDVDALVAYLEGLK